MDAFRMRYSGMESSMPVGKYLPRRCRREPSLYKQPLARISSNHILLFPLLPRRTTRVTRCLRLAEFRADQQRLDERQACMEEWQKSQDVHWSPFLASQRDSNDNTAKERPT
ncbi:hypothetical protein AXF42_Ash013275 [Apostasia shenzhenica]|uniref:Uncharacterized protein n=1 Tax=Apostasia shenzhenica TaxID=1088818 RepID=A0A2I0BBI3_9ASPA|nr:hypothetical protein AXF42_Ash013275 [Apostasia shenzhenica]